MRVGFEVISVERDGRDDNYSVESISNGKRIKIGNADLFLEDGEHTYKIAYRTTRQIGFFENYDELYWNVTGNGWTLPIERASTIIRLPNGGKIGQHAVYTGYQGTNGKDAVVVLAEGNRFEAKTTRRLGPSEGFTVALAWPKGLVLPPTDVQMQQDWLRDNLGFFGLAATLLLVPLYYFMAWLRVGRDPQKGTIVPLFRPPEGMGASCVRYIYKAGYDDKAFAAGIVSLAVKGRMKITNVDDDYRIAKTETGSATMTRSETALYHATPSGILELQQSNHRSVQNMRGVLEGALDDEYDGVMYLKNIKWFVLGLVLSVVGVLISALLLPNDQKELILAAGLFSMIWWGIILTVGTMSVRGLFMTSGWFSKIKSLMGLVFLLPFAGFGLVVPSAIWSSGGYSTATLWYVGGVIALLAFNFIFYWLLKAPTPRGRAVLDQIEGFRMYLTTAEEERLRVLNPPEKTPELFERYLPFAMALDCENEWNAKFATILAAASTAGAVGGWYTGPGGFNSRSFGQDLGTSLTSSISSSGTAPAPPPVQVAEDFLAAAAGAVVVPAGKQSASQMLNDCSISGVKKRMDAEWLVYLVISHEEHLISNALGIIGLVRNHQHGETALCLNAFDQRKHVLPKRRPQRSEGLIQQQYRLLPHQHPGQCNALALTAGHIAGAARG